MEYKRLKDYTLTIFADMQTEIADMKLFSYVSAEYLDLFLNHFYSERIASAILDSVSTSTLAKILAHMYRDKWDNLIDFALYSYNAISTGGTQTETYKQTDTKGTETTTTGQVSPYNDDDFANRDKSVVANSGTDTTEHEKITTGANLYNVNLQNFRDYLNDSNIYDTIMADVLHVISLYIY